VVLALVATPSLAAPRVMSLDQCADQYVMALSPRDAIVGVSMRAGDPDSYLHAQAAGLPRRRASAESVLAARPNVVVRYWGGDALLSRTLARRGVTVVTPAGFSTGPGTLIDAMLRGAGLNNRTTTPGYSQASMERLVIDPPVALVLGFFDAYGLSQQLWAPGRRTFVRRLTARREIASLPGAVLDCPAWFAADGVQAIAGARARAK